jgi:hypothetical protein
MKIEKHLTQLNKRQNKKLCNSNIHLQFLLFICHRQFVKMSEGWEIRNKKGKKSTITVFVDFINPFLKPPKHV